ncbi:MFS transporter [Bacillus sp. 3255]|uniref:MFS transporter n=1 Tax=Bacillus sp. 3255 TaxID=2817904 RepID=UPI00285A956A|nr:MFS transporter [Bacillus sp. 3255]MDR6885035.1 PPP family 3-phenylpropionic acid transporter [Bacillus sp. 3255]
MSALSMAAARPFGVIKGFNFVVYGALAVYSSFFPLYLKDFGMSSIAIGLLLAGGPVISLLANPFWGYWSDRLANVRRILTVLLIGSLLSLQSVFVTSSYALMITFLLIYFFFQTPLFSQSNSLILEAIEGTGRKFGAFRLWGSLGWALMALAAGPVIGWLGIHRLWAVCGLLLGLSILFAWMLPGGARSGGSGRGVQRGNYFQIMGNKWFMAFIGMGILISIPNAMNNTFVSIYMSDLGGKSALIGWSAFFASIFEIPVYLLFDRFLRKDKRTMILCLAVVSLLYALRWYMMAEAVSPYQIMFIQALNAITFAGYYYVGTQLTAQLIPPEYRASGQAVYALSWGGLSGIVAGLAGGWIYQELGAKSMYNVSALLALLGMAGFAVMFVLARSRKRPHEKTGFLEL